MEENKTYILCEKFLFYKILSECFLKGVGPVQQTADSVHIKMCN